MNSILPNSFASAFGTSAARSSGRIEPDYGTKWRKIALQSVETRKKCLNWHMVMGLAMMAGVSAAGWTATGMVISRLLR
jgi:hypothetical protein